MSRSNSGFAQIYLVLILIFLISLTLNLSFYFNPNHEESVNKETEKPLNTVSKYEESIETKVEEIEPTLKIDPVNITSYANYYEIKDTNSKTNYSLKFPKNYVFEGQEVSEFPESKRKTTRNELEFSYTKYTDKDQFFELRYDPKMIIPTEGIIFDNFSIILDAQKNKNFDVDFYINEQNRLFNVKPPSKTKIGSFEGYIFKGMPDGGLGHIETLIKIDEDYYVFIKSASVGYEKNGKNDKYLDLYYEIVNSIQKIN